MLFGKKPADRMVQLFTDALKKDGIKYTAHDEKPAVFVDYSGDNYNRLRFGFWFDEDGESVQLKVFSIFQFTKAQLPDAYEFCNQMNADWRWIRFYVDSDDELTADMDAVISPTTVGKECVEILHRARSIIDKVVGELKG